MMDQLYFGHLSCFTISSVKYMINMQNFRVLNSFFFLNKITKMCNANGSSITHKDFELKNALDLDEK